MTPDDCLHRPTDPASRQPHRWIEPAAIILLPLIVHLPALLGFLSANPIYWMSHLALHPPQQTQLMPGFPGWVDGNAGITTQALGRLAAEDWLHGIVPWWNPYSGIGLPLAAEMQCSALFLPFVLLLHFDDGVLYLKLVLQIVTATCMLALLRQLGVGRRVALLGAVMAEFNGTFAWFSHAPIMPVAFLPLLLLGIERCRAQTRDGKPGGWLAIAAAIAFSITAGFPETAYLDGLLGLAWALYRVVTFGPGGRGLAGRITIGGITGLLISAPAWLAFLEFLPRAYVSVHADYSGEALLPGSYAMLLLPYIYGSLLYGPEMLGQQANLWWHNGGYCDLLLIFLAGLGLLQTGGRDRGLRWLLVAWCAVTLGKAARLHLFADALNLLPFIKQTMFFVYITPSWEISLIILACLALDDWHRGRVPTASRVLAAGALCVAAAGVAIMLGSSDIALLATHVRGYGLFALGSVALAMFGIAAIAVLMTRTPGVRRSTALCAFVTANSLLLFALPVLSGTHGAKLDLGPVTFLRDRLGLSRFFSMWVLPANYGAYFGIASVNHIYLPVPQSWVDYIHSHISATMDGVTFFGESLGVPGPGEDLLTDAIAPRMPVRDALRAYEKLGVRYVLAPSGTYPFTDNSGPPLSLTRNLPVILANGQALAGSFPAGWFRDGVVRGIGVQIGTFFGAADGTLQISVCSGTACAQANASAARTADNNLAWATFNTPLHVSTGQQLLFRVHYINATHHVVVWLWPLQSAAKPVVAGPDGLHRDLAPLLSLRYETDAPLPALVYRSKTTDIYELGDPAPYFSTLSGHCQLRPVSRDTLSAACTAPDILIRRELLFPGWTAMIDTRHEELRAHDTIFQSLDLPQGNSLIRFFYRPPYIGWAYGATGLGLLAVVASLTFRNEGRNRGKPCDV